MGQKRLALFQEIQNKKRDNDMFVDLTIYDVPSLLSACKNSYFRFERKKRLC